MLAGTCSTITVYNPKNKNIWLEIRVLKNNLRVLSSVLRVCLSVTISSFPSQRRHLESHVCLFLFFKESQVLLMLGLTASKKKQNITESWNSQEICEPYDTTPHLHSRIQLASPGFTRPKGLPPEWAWLSRKVTDIHTDSCQILLLLSLAYGKC